MNKQSGFTLIELVIVIIILGILAATAVPKFVDLQGDARESAMKGVKGALEGAATLTYSRAAIEGIEKAATGTNADGIALAYGYPAATKVALEAAAGLAAADWTITAATTTGTAIIVAEGAPDDADTAGSTACRVTYAQATASLARPTITVEADGC